MSVQYFYEVSSPPFHMVPHSPFIRKTTTIASSPVATVPDIDNSSTLVTKNASYIGRQAQLFAMVNSSPLPSGQVPSVSPRTPLNSQYNIQPTSREQQVPSRTPLLRKKDNLSTNITPTLDLFTDEDTIFL